MAGKWSRGKGSAVALALGLGLVIGFDILISLLFARDGYFLTILPPYPLTFTDQQKEILTHLGEDKPDSYGRFDARLGWSIAPNRESSDGMYRSNSAGFRALKDYSQKPQPGIVRVAAFGDSFVHCTDVAIEESWPFLLEQSKPELEVLNFGVSAYGTDQAYLRYLQDGKSFEPHIVLIGIMIENIMRNVSVYRPAYFHLTGSLGLKPRFRLTRSGELELLPTPAASESELKELIESRRLLDILYETDYWVARSPQAYKGSIFFLSSMIRLAYAKIDHHSRKQVASFYRDTTSEPFQVSVRILVDFYRTALDNGAERAYVLILPHKPALKERAEGSAVYWKTLVDALTAEGIPVIDIAEHLVKKIPANKLSDLFITSHYGLSGNAEVAAILKETIFPD